MPECAELSLERRLLCLARLQLGVELEPIVTLIKQLDAEAREACLAAPRAHDAPHEAFRHRRAMPERKRVATVEEACVRLSALQAQRLGTGGEPREFSGDRRE